MKKILTGLKYASVTVAAAALAFVGLTVAAPAPQASAAAAPFSCSANFYQVSGGTVYQYTPSTSQYAQLGTSAAVSSLNAIGYNTEDNYIYGISGSKLYQIAGDGSSTSYTLSGTAQSTGGDFIAPNELLTSNSSGTWSLVDTTAHKATAFATTGSKWTAYDFAFNPATGIGYGMSGTTLYIGQVTGTSSIAVTTKPTTGSGAASGDNWGAAYVDSSGNAYFFDNSTYKLVEVSASQLALDTPAATLITTAGSLAAPNDGASCPTASSPLAPTSTTSQPSQVTSTTATLAGTVVTGSPANSDIPDGGIQFCYSTSDTVVNGALSVDPVCASASPSSAGINSTTPVSLDVTGLEPNTTYYVQIASTNNQQLTGYSSVGTFTTEAAAVTPKSATTTTVSADPASAALGSDQTFTATVASASATGTVSFVDSTTGVTLCDAAPISVGIATCDTTATGRIGAHSVTATYSGDANYAASSGSTTATVTKIASTLTDTANGVASTSVSYGTTATLDAAGPATGSTGTIRFTDQNDAELCSATLPDTSCTTRATLAPGSYAVTASYLGDDTHAAATTTTPATLVVTKAGVTTLGSTVNGVASATTIHGSSTVLDTTGIPAGSTGTITYETADGTVLCTATLPDTSCATPSNLAGGTYDVTSHYSGDELHAAAVGPVIRLGVAPQATGVSGSSAPVSTGGSTGGSSGGSSSTTTSGTTLTATGLPDGATGTVTFSLADGTVLCTATLPDTSCTTTALTAGTHSVTVAYSGDPSFAASRTSIRVEVPAAAAAAPAPAGAPAPTATRAPAPVVAASTVAALAFTGSESVATWLTGAGLLLALGLGLALLGRRRRQERAQH